MPVVIFLILLPLLGAILVVGFGMLLQYVLFPAAIAAGVITLGIILFKTADEAKASVSERKAVRTETIRLHVLASRTYPTTEQFLDALSEHLAEELKRARLTPPRELLQQMMLAAKEMYEADLPDPPPPMPKGDWFYGPFNTIAEEKTYQEQLRPAATYAQVFDAQVIGNAMIMSFMAFARALPPVRETQFSAPLEQFIPVADLVSKVISPYYGLNATLLSNVREHHRDAAIAALYTQGTARDRKEGKLVWPRQYTGVDVAGRYLPPNLAKLFDMRVPFGLSNETRYMHHHVLGDTGTGKTTYLSHLIRYDLDRVAANQCSVVIIDSTRRMVRSLAGSTWFAPGGPLHGRLVLVGPEDPVALNLFADKTNIDASVDIISYAIAGNLQGGDASIFQSGAARYITRAIIEHGGNLLDFEKILQPKGHIAYQDAINRSPPNVRDYFQRTFGGLREQSRQSLLEKIAFVREKPVLERMFTAPDCRLDLFKELQTGGKVVLIDTDKDELTSEGSSLLGRFFIAMLNRVVQQRSKSDEFSLNPVFVFLDEAQNYIEHDDRFAELLTDARQRRVGLTVAHHDWRQIFSQKVKLGLEGAAIHTNTVKRGRAAVSFRGGTAYEIPYDNFQFRTLPPMTPENWADVRAENHARYGILKPQPPSGIAVDQDAATEF